MASTSKVSERNASPTFWGLEALLLLLIPLLGFVGFNILLETRTGTFVADPVEGEPGWRALVDPSPVTAVVETENGQITGLTVLAQSGTTAAGGAVVLVPGTLVVNGTPLSANDPEVAAVALGTAMRLQITNTIVMDVSDWTQLLGDQSYGIDVPDPVPNDAGGVLIPVGQNEIGGAEATAFLGRMMEGNDPRSLIFRRRLLWEAMLESPPTSTQSALAPILTKVAEGTYSVHALPIGAEGDQLLIVPDETELLVREIVPIPAGSAPGDRLQVRVIDRSGSADLAALAAGLGRNGIEVIEIGNAWEYDSGATQLVVPSASLDLPEVIQLAELVNADTVAAAEISLDETLTLLVGADVAVPTN